MCSLDAQHIVAHLHESEQIHLGRDHGLLSLRKVELGVGEGLESLTGLFLGDVAGTLQVVESEDVLELLVGVDNGAGTILLANFNLVNDELVDSIRLLVCQQSSQILY